MALESVSRLSFPRSLKIPGQLEGWYLCAGVDTIGDGVREREKEEAKEEMRPRIKSMLLRLLRKPNMNI